MIFFWQIQAKRTAAHLRWTMLRMAEGELPDAGAKLRGNDAVPLMLACRTVAKAAAKLAVDPDSNEAEVHVRCCLFFSCFCVAISSVWCLSLASRDLFWGTFWDIEGRIVVRKIIRIMLVACVACWLLEHAPFVCCSCGDIEEDRFGGQSRLCTFLRSPALQVSCQEHQQPI